MRNAATAGRDTARRVPTERPPLGEAVLVTLAAALILAVFAFVLPASSRAQIVDAYGIKAGIVSADATNNFSDEFGERIIGRRLGLSATLFAERQLAPFLSAVGEAGYVQRGFVESAGFYVRRGSRSPETIDVNADPSTRLDYLTFSIMGKLSVAAGRKVRLYALAGPRLDVLVGRDPGRFRRATGSNLPVLFPETNTAEDYESPAAGGTVGLGFSVPIGVSPLDKDLVRLVLEGRGDFDLTDSYDGEASTMRNNALSLVIGVSF